MRESEILVKRHIADLRMCPTRIFAKAENGIVVVHGEHERAVTEGEAFGDYLCGACGVCGEDCDVR